MQRRFLAQTTAGLVLAAAASTARGETPPTHRMSFHVGSADPVMMNVALHNIIAAIEYYGAHKETVAIELVANGPGYTMPRADTSPVKAFIAEESTPNTHSLSSPPARTPAPPSPRPRARPRRTSSKSRKRPTSRLASYG